MLSIDINRSVESYKNGYRGAIKSYKEVGFY